MGHSMIARALILGVALALAACGGSEPAPAPEPAPTTEPASTDVATTLAMIAKSIRADPDAYEAILARHGMTVEQFEKALYDVASDPEATARYHGALK